MSDSIILKIAGAASFVISLLHVIIIFVGGPGYRYFGAGEEMAVLDEQGSWYPALLTLFIAIVFLGFGLLALSGAGMIKKMPWLKGILLTIASIYTLRGIVAVLQLIYLLNGRGELKDMLFSLVALITGLLYFSGTYARWKKLETAGQ